MFHNICTSLINCQNNFPNNIIIKSTIGSIFPCKFPDFREVIRGTFNNNFLFDLPEEEIAYLDSNLLVDAAYFKSILLTSGKYDSIDFVQDTLPLAIDTAGLSADTIAMMLDSLEQAKPDVNSIYVDLFMFTEETDHV